MKMRAIVAVLMMAAGAAVVWGQTVPGTGPATATRPTTGRGGRGPAWTGPWSPEVLPGKGLAGHNFMYAGEAAPLNIFIVKDGKVAWQYTHPKPAKGDGEISDASVLANGNILFAFQWGAAIVTPEKKIVWSVDAEPNTEIHTAQAFGGAGGADKVMYVMNGSPAKLRVVDVATGKTEKEFELPTRYPTPTAAQIHPQFRRARVLQGEGGKVSFLVSHMDNGKVSEYDGEGKEIWKVDIASPWSAERLKNGNTLITSNNGFVREVNAKGETVWELRQADVPEYRLANTQTAVRLANGNTVISNWSSPQGANVPVQFIEVTPEKKVVWALRSWTEPNLGRSSNIQFLDGQ